MSVVRQAILHNIALVQPRRRIPVARFWLDLLESLAASAESPRRLRREIRGQFEKPEKQASREESPDQLLRLAPSGLGRGQDSLRVQRTAPLRSVPELRDGADTRTSEDVPEVPRARGGSQESGRLSREYPGRTGRYRVDWIIPPGGEPRVGRLFMDPSRTHPRTMLIRPFHARAGRLFAPG